MSAKSFCSVIFYFLLSFAALSFSTSCTEDIEKKEDVPILVESISLNVKKVELLISNSYKFSPIIQPENATDKTLEWKSDDTAIATVSEEGEVVAIAEGSTTITATAVGGVYATCSVVVIDPNAEPEPEPEPDPEPEPEPEPEAELLKGTIIGTELSVDYSQNGYPASTTANTKPMAFDGNFDTFFASYDRSGTWVGMDLGEKHVITKIGYAPRREQSRRVELAVIEGANEADFSDAMPIHIIKESAPEGQMTYAEVNCSRGFRYVRYVTPNDARCNIAELAFYGLKMEGDDSRLYQATNLPMVVINTEGAQDIVSKENEITSTVYIISENGTALLTDTETGVRGRGNSSWTFDKKPYRLKFSEKRSPLGAPAKAKKWTLINNHSDKSLLRNIVAFEISRRMGMAYTPFCHPVDVFLNGEYKGCYQLCDQIEVNENRVNVTEIESGDSDITGGYLIEIDGNLDVYQNEEFYFHSNKRIPVTIKSPDEGDAEKAYITDYFNKMEAAVFAENFDDEAEGYRKYLDLESFLRNFIISELVGNPDAFWSVYMYKERGQEKLFTGPIWDNDLSFHNSYYVYPASGMKDFLYTHHISDGTPYASSSAGPMRDIVNRIIKDDAKARAQLIEMWEDARQNRNITALSLLEYINQTKRLIDESQALNFKRWNILNEKFHQNVSALGSHDAEVNAVRDYLSNRLTQMDRLIRGN